MSNSSRGSAVLSSRNLQNTSWWHLDWDRARLERRVNVIAERSCSAHGRVITPRKPVLHLQRAGGGGNPAGLCQQLMVSIHGPTNLLLPFPCAERWGYGSLRFFVNLFKTNKTTFMKMFDSWHTGRAWAPDSCLQPRAGAFRKGASYLCDPPLVGPVWNQGQNEGCSPASGVDGALSFWEWVSGVWSLKYILKNHNPTDEPKSWGLCFGNMVRDCRKCVIRNDAKQCFGSRLWERCSWAVAVYLSKNLPILQKALGHLSLCSGLSLGLSHGHVSSMSGQGMGVGSQSCTMKLKSQKLF